ncbi:hypothetical protein [Peredibacter starrii]|uniref:DUF4430 domain-containing protein n=1 Tax=Peredibacter starrii TaxID=28202 RepID=A0AAX4HM15_9BACT|nr:hypothetical protein [Peredibacter starrii]WPU63969.1 hypothetical protein SOO65_14835 [Peredibacter starrii]
MKKLILLTLMTFSAHAVELKFIGPCDEDFIMKTEVTEDFPNVGELTIATLAKFNIPFKGSSEGLASAFETPTGAAAIEKISEVEYRAYGWCFSVDGEAPDLYPHQVQVTPLSKEITWTFGFARYYKGEWITQCTPAFTVKPAFLCEDKP